MSKIKEFEELKSPQEYTDLCSRSVEYPSYCLDLEVEALAEQIQKDAWNAAIRCAAEACEFYCDKQLVLTQLVNGN